MIIPAAAILVVLAWVLVEIYASRILWLRIACGLVAIGVSVASAIVLMQAYMTYLTDVHTSLLRSLFSDMKQPSVEKTEFWETRLPQIEAHRNSIPQMHRLFVEHDRFMFETLRKEELEQGAAANP